jgi:hypothetical protein
MVVAILPSQKNTLSQDGVFFVIIKPLISPLLGLSYVTLCKKKLKLL